MTAATAAHRRLVYMAHLNSLLVGRQRRTGETFYKRKMALPGWVLDDDHGQQEMSGKTFMCHGPRRLETQICDGWVKRHDRRRQHNMPQMLERTSMSVERDSRRRNEVSKRVRAVDLCSIGLGMMRMMRPVMLVGDD